MSNDNSPVFLGVLRSEYDLPDNVAAPFITVTDLVERILDAWVHARIDRDIAAGLLASTKLVTADGYTWAMGATTRRWYRRPSSEHPWRVANPPANLPMSESITAQLDDMSTKVNHTLNAGDAPAQTFNQPQTTPAAPLAANTPIDFTYVEKDEDADDLNKLLGEGYG